MIKIAILSLFLCSCAETRFYENGHLVAVIQGDYERLEIITPAGGKFYATRVDHSSATKAGGIAVMQGVSSLGAAVMGAAAVIK